MSKLAPSSTKYLVKAKIKAKGVVERPDVIGAIFGQTEGLLGQELNLRELQRTGKIGRIEVKIKSEKGNSEGEIIIPSSLSSSETALIAATLETIERIGPCNAKIHLEGVEDAMASKRQQIVDKAKDIVKSMIESTSIDTTEISEKIRESINVGEITSHKGLPCGTGLVDSDSVIIVEGRADVINLLKFGIKNTIAVGGTSVPDAISEICKTRESTALVDGDRGGSLIVKEIMQKAELDYVAKAPEGKEVEELSKKEVFKALRDRVTSAQFLQEESGNKSNYRPSDRIEKRDFKKDDSRGRLIDSRKPRYERSDRKMDKPIRLPRINPDQKKLFKKTLEELVGTRAACIFDSDSNLLGRVPVTELINTVKTVDSPNTVIFDGKIDSDMEFIARRKGVKFLVGMERDPAIRSSVVIISKEDLD